MGPTAQTPGDTPPLQQSAPPRALLSAEQEGQLDPEDILAEINDFPYLLLNFKEHLCSFSVGLFIKNNSPYEVKISSGECKTMISNYGFIDLEKAKPLALKPRARGQYRFEKSLTDVEIRRALKFFGDVTERPVHVHLAFSLTTPFGDREIHLPSKATCIIMYKEVPPGRADAAMRTFSSNDIRIAILKELAQAGKELHKLNLLGNYPGTRGPLENRLGITFDKSQRALAAQMFDDLKQRGLTRSLWGPGQVDPENWAEITEAGLEALRKGVIKDTAVGGGGKFGIPDHSAFQDKLSGAIEGHDLLSLLFLDLDNFKSVNDKHDHSTGDQVIREAITIIREAIKGKGELFHRSGDEMLVLLPSFDEDEAYGVAERVRKTIEVNEFSSIGKGIVTATIGLATYPSTCTKWEELEVIADRAAMRAKTSGAKNSVAVTSLRGLETTEQERDLEHEGWQQRSE